MTLCVVVTLKIKSVYKTFGQIPSLLKEAEKGPPSFFTNGKKKEVYTTQGHGSSSSQSKAHRYGPQVLSPTCFMMQPNLKYNKGHWEGMGVGRKAVTEEKGVNFGEVKLI